jgi:putative membrane protein insertion efficiency factor
MKTLFILLVRVYQYGISSWIPARCRFTPTCSAYAIEALRTHGACAGVKLALQRLLRCHPFGGSGYDPVPPSLDSRCTHHDTLPPRS